MFHASFAIRPPELTRERSQSTHSSDGSHLAVLRSGMHIVGRCTRFFSHGFFNENTNQPVLRTTAPAASTHMSNPRNAPTHALVRYLNSFHAELFTEAFTKLALDAKEQDCMCSISLEVTNKPVRVDGVLLDYASVLALPVAANGTRKHPTTRDTFYLDQVQPDRESKEKIEALIAASEITFKP